MSGSYRLATPDDYDAPDSYKFHVEVTAFKQVDFTIDFSGSTHFTLLDGSGAKAKSQKLKVSVCALPALVHALPAHPCAPFPPSGERPAV